MEGVTSTPDGKHRESPPKLRTSLKIADVFTSYEMSAGTREGSFTNSTDSRLSTSRRDSDFSAGHSPTTRDLKTIKRLDKAITARSASLSSSRGSLSLDICSLRFEEVGLVGRDAEIKILMDTLGRIEEAGPSSRGNKSALHSNRRASSVEEQCKSGLSEMILVSGKTGTGKTCLVAELRRARRSQVQRQPTAGHGSFTKFSTSTFSTLYASGKFDQNLGDAMTYKVPFKAFSRAFSQLVSAVIDLSKSDHKSFQYILEQVRAAVPSQAERTALRFVVPNIDILLDYDNEEKVERTQPCSDEKQVAADADVARAKQIKDANPTSIGLRRRASSFEDLFCSSHLSISSCSASDFGYGGGGFDGGRTKNILFFLVRRFVRAVSTCADSHPVVLVIDDLQWADESSLEMLVNLASDREMRGLLLVGCRREEVSNESLDSSMEEIAKYCAFPITNINISSLSVQALNELLADLLTSDESKTMELAAVIHKKTGGNAFFVRQFLVSLHDQEFLKYNTGLMAWQYDAGSIRSGTSIADNVADLMTDKIQNKVSEAAQDIMKMASCMGSTFYEKTIVVIWHGLKARESKASDEIPQSTTEAADMVAHSLKLCVDEGLLEPVHASEEDSNFTRRYRFSHDHVQLAAFLLIPELERGLLQLYMGEILMEELSDEDLDEGGVFVAADLCNRGVEFIPTLAEARRLSLIRLNLRAGKKATEASAFSSALSYLRTAISLVKRLGRPEKVWTSSRDIGLELFVYAADAAFCRGHMEEMQSYIDEVLAQPNLTFSDKLRVYSTLVRSLGVQNKLLEAIDTSLYVLGELGINFPKRRLKLAVLNNLLKTTRLINQYNRANLLELPVLEDEEMIVSMGIMDNLFSYTYAANQDLMALLILKMARRSVKYGICKYSPPAFAAFGNLVSNLLGDFRKGHMYAEVALSLYKRLGAKEMEARTIFICYNFVLHWNDPLQLSFNPYLSGYQSGLETGDLENAMFCITYHCDVALHTGRPLSLISADFEAFTQQMKDFELEYNYQITTVPWQLALNLMGRSADPLVLTGRAMDQDAMLAAGAQVPFLRSLTCAARMLLAYYFGEFHLAWEMVEATRDLPKTNLGQYVVWRCSLFEGLTAFALAHESEEKVWVRRALIVMKRVKKWIAKGNVNCVHFMHLLEAEKAALQGQEQAARAAYDLAISLAARNGFSNDQALAYERAGIYFISVSRSAELEKSERGSFWASHYLTNAYKLYSAWEAWGKTNQLKEAYPDWLSDIDTDKE